ncbi:uncharacterized protein JCM10292_004821 [Rhodotorula paludigena]|uniref:uncharacterized protein n=1 Tax=Rhodotorula paludigena TaxID=86838 RepID=UPI0031715323
MPLLRRRPVQLLPLPNLDGVDQNRNVFFLKATGEIFLDYESYAARLTFLLTRQFQCEYSGKSGLDYFNALQSEKAESKVVRERFPDPLKGRVLASVQFQVMGRLDSLVDLVYERYKDRYFPGEKVFVDLSGDKYFAKISSVFPPQRVREAGAAEPSTSAEPDSYEAIAHKLGIDMNADAKRAKAEDNPDEYLYKLQLMDEEHKFEGSTMEVGSRLLSRDRLAFSKSILKRYLRECLMRDAAIGAPWVVKPSIARAFNIPLQQSDDIEERNRQAKEAKLAKRRKAGGPEGGDGTSSAPTKRRKTAATAASAGGAAGASGSATPYGEAKPAVEPKKPIKYPIEDLDLDPMSIHDGRVLRRVNAELPQLPPKPQPNRALPVPAESFDRFIETWNMLNVFCKPLNLSPFTVDDYANALAHSTTSPRCVLLTEIHASLTNVIGTDNSRVLGSTTAVSSQHGGARGAAAGTGADATPVPDDGREGTPNGGEGEDQLGGEMGDADDAGAGAGGEIAYEQSELNKLVRLGISYAKRWDRQAKLKYSEGREGWERHLIGAVCQRGGPIYLDNFVRIMRHLFAGHPNLPEQDYDFVEGAEGDEDVKPQTGDSAANGAERDQSGDKSATEAPEENGDSAHAPSSRRGSSEPLGTSPEQQYLTLELDDKLEIIAYLCTLVMGSKAVRGYIDECESRLTGLRKTRAEHNKERKSLLEQKAIQEAQGSSGAAIPNGDGSAPKPANGTPAAEADSRGPSRAPSESGTPSRQGSVKPPPPPGAGGGDEDDEEDQLVSDAESSVAPSETGSLSRRQAALEEKRLEKLSGRSGGRSSLAGTPKSGAKATSTPSAPLSIEDRLRDNQRRDDVAEREFRRYLNVSRCRPLGKDRFHCRYWWFDGVGGMDLVQPGGSDVLDEEGNNVVYGSGRLFVQGPSEEDWDSISDPKGKGDEGVKAMLERRVREEVVAEPSALLGPNEWAFFEDDDELDSLLAWLNSKGTREAALKSAIGKWRSFIVGGAKKRRKDIAHPELPRYEMPTTSGRRSGRKVEYSPNTYMGWLNFAAKFV